MLYGLKQITSGSVAQRRPEFVREFWEQGDIALLAPLGMRDQQHLLVKIDIGNLQVHKLGHARAGLELGLDQQAPYPRHPIGLRNQALLFDAREAGDYPLARGWPGDG